MTPPAPSIGSRWQHYKGAFYTVICLAKQEGSAEPLVVYKAAADGQTWVRPLTEWHQLVGKNAPRFSPVGAAALPLRDR